MGEEVTTAVACATVRQNITMLQFAVLSVAVFWMTTTYCLAFDTADVRDISFF
jgi:hypothetical protein